MAFELSKLKEKAGPLPIWAWAVITAFVGIAIVYYVRARGKVTNSGTSTTATTTTDPYAAFQNYAAAPTTTVDQGASGSYETNQSWLSKAVSWLTGQGLGTALDSQAALNNYLNNGGVLDQGQTKLVNAALNQFGLPPDQVYGSPSGTNPSANPTVLNYIRSPSGSIAVVYANGTKADFTNYNAYAAFSAKHPAGAWQQVTDAFYSSVPSAAKDPNF